MKDLQKSLDKYFQEEKKTEIEKTAKFVKEYAPQLKFTHSKSSSTESDADMPQLIKNKGKDAREIESRSSFMKIISRKNKRASTPPINDSLDELLND